MRINSGAVQRISSGVAAAQDGGMEFEPSSVAAGGVAGAAEQKKPQGLLGRAFSKRPGSPARGKKKGKDKDNAASLPFEVGGGTSQGGGKGGDGDAPVSSKGIRLLQRFRTAGKHDKKMQEALESMRECTSVKAVGFSEDPNTRFRPTMEDAHVIEDGFRANPKEAFFAVYDGHGGRSAVDLVAKHLHTIFEQQLKENQGEEHHISKAFLYSYLKTDQILYENKCLFVGTTSVTCYIQDLDGQRRLITANAGDARAVLSRNGSPVRLTYDHKASDPHEERRVKDAGGFVASRRVNGILSVSRALGDHAMKSVVICAPTVSEETLSEDDRFLVIACDGLWDVSTDEEVVKFVNDKFNQGLDVQTISRRLVKNALDKGSTDNISIMIVQL